jgi:1-acyl-sn-glycerol-3-phosphate acyltransferase
VAHLWGRLIFLCFGSDVRVEGAEHLRPDEPRMLVANHASYLDPPAMLAAFPGQARFILKRELGRMPFIGWYCALAGHFLIDRSRAREGRDLLAGAIRRVRERRISPIVFAEGTRSADGRLQALKAGAFELALGAGIAVQPCAILGTFARMPRGALGPRASGPIVVRVGPPIGIEGLEGSAGRRDLARRTREALLALGVEGVP